jgi:hypothetical protein
MRKEVCRLPFVPLCACPPLQERMGLQWECHDGAADQRPQKLIIVPKSSRGKVRRQFE